MHIKANKYKNICLAQEQAATCRLAYIYAFSTVFSLVISPEIQAFPVPHSVQNLFLSSVICSIRQRLGVLAKQEMKELGDKISDKKMANMGSENLYNTIVLTQLRKLHKELVFGILTPNHYNAGKRK